MGSSGMNAEYMGHLVICSPELHNSDMTNYNCKLFFVFMLVISTLTPSDSTTTTPVVTTTTTATTTPAATTTTSGVPSMSAPLSVLATVMMMKQLLLTDIIHSTGNHTVWHLKERNHWQYLQ